VVTREVDHGTGGSEPGATVTPIRPEIQLADTTPFGASSSVPTLPPAVDEGSWGVSPHRRMQVEQPDQPATAEPPAAAASQAARDDPLPDGVPDGTYARDEPAAIRQVARHQVHGRGAWSSVASLALIALLGGAFAVITAVHSASPRAALSRPATPSRQRAAALSSLSASRALSLPQVATRQRVSRQRSPRRSKLRQTRLRRHITRGETPSPTTAASQPSAEPVYAPVTQRAQTTQTVNNTSGTVNNTSGTTSDPNTSASPPPAPRPPAPAGPTGSGALLGSGHCSC